MYQRILVPFDGSQTSSRGLAEAIRLAALTHGSLRLLHMVDDLLYVTGFEGCSVHATDIAPLMREAGEKILQQGRLRVLKAGVDVDSVLIDGIAPRLSSVVQEQVE